jgi:hypothetical protein
LYRTIVGVLPAIVTRVGDSNEPGDAIGVVDLVVFGHPNDGPISKRFDVDYDGRDEAPPQTWHWMPYQLGKAKEASA